MPEPVISHIPTPSRLVQALIQVARGVAEDVIQRAQLTHTPVILADDQGHILSVNPEELAKQFKDDTAQ